MKVLKNADTGVIRNLTIGSYFEHDVSVTEVLYDGPREYLVRYPNPREDIPPLDLLIATLSQELHADETMQRRIFSKRELRHEGNRVFVLEFERTDPSDREVRYTSKLFGIEVIGERLGAKDWCFSISSPKEEGDTRHSLTEKIIMNDQGSMWQRRLTEIRVGLRVTRDNQSEIDDVQVFTFDADRIAQHTLQCVPRLKLTSVQAGMMYRSFVSEKNPGVQVGILQGLPVYLRLAPNEVGTGRDYEKRRALAVQPHEHLMLRESSVQAEFFVKTVADPYRNDKSPQDTDYSKELELMQQAAEELYVGIWLWKQ